MRLKPIAIALACLTLVFEFVLGDYNKADSELQIFYSQMLSADFASARTSIDEAIGLWPRNGRYYDWRAYVTSQNLPSTCLGQTRGQTGGLTAQDRAAIQDAMLDYERALQLNHWDAIARHNLAWLEHLQGHDEDAGQNWKTATDLDAANALFHLSYGMFLEEEGRGDVARSQYEAAIEISPSILDSQFFIRYQGRNKAAADSLVGDLIRGLEEKLQRAPSDPIVKAKLGKLYLVQRKPEQALQLLRDAADQLPSLALVWTNLGQAYEEEGLPADARNSYEKAEFNSSSYLPFFGLAELELTRGDTKSAARNFEQALVRWQRAMPIMAAHNNRLYQGPPERIDDLLPTTIVWYTSPCIASEAWKGLSQIYPDKREYAERIRVCQEMPSPHAFRGNRGS